MVFGSESYAPPQEGVMWDLRQFYVQWVQGYMVNFSEADLSDNYPEMFRSLKKWHSIIWGRAIKEFTEDKSKDKTFGKLISNLVELFNKEKYKNTYLLKEKNPEAIDAFNSAFESTVIYIIHLMKKNKLFGSDTINRGLI